MKTGILTYKQSVVPCTPICTHNVCIVIHLSCLCYVFHYTIPRAGNNKNKSKMHTIICWFISCKGIRHVFKFLKLFDSINITQPDKQYSKSSIISIQCLCLPPVTFTDPSPFERFVFMSHSLARFMFSWCLPGWRQRSWWLSVTQPPLAGLPPEAGRQAV